MFLSRMRATYPVHLIIDLTCLIIGYLLQTTNYGALYYAAFSSIIITLSVLVPYFLASTLLQNALSLYSFFGVKKQISEPLKGS